MELQREFKERRVQRIWYLREEKRENVKEKEENVEGMITISKDTGSSHQGKNLKEAICCSEARLQQRIPASDWMIGISWLPCRSVVLKGRGGILCRGADCLRK